jgi:hypothetical protein
VGLPEFVFLFQRHVSVGVATPGWMCCGNENPRTGAGCGAGSGWMGAVLRDGDGRWGRRKLGSCSGGTSLWVWLRLAGCAVGTRTLHRCRLRGVALGGSARGGRGSSRSWVGADVSADVNDGSCGADAVGCRGLAVSCCRRIGWVPNAAMPGRSGVVRWLSVGDHCAGLIGGNGNSLKRWPKRDCQIRSNSLMYEAEPRE